MAPIEFDGNIQDDDRGADEEAAAAASEAIGHIGPKPAPLRRPRRTPYFKTLGFRQTAIPVMLTTGVMLLAVAVAARVVAEDAPLSRLPLWSAILFAVTGLVLAALGVANALMVRAELSKNNAE